MRIFGAWRALAREPFQGALRQQRSRVDIVDLNLAHSAILSLKDEQKNCAMHVYEQTGTQMADKVGGKPAKEATERIAFRMPEIMAEHLRYWSKKHGVSMNEYALEAFARAIAWENQDYPLPTLEQQRLNQMLDEMKAMTTSLRNLEHVTVTGFDSLLGLTRGDSYLMDEEDGEL